MPVEEQVAIIYVAGQGLIDAVPIENIRAFEQEFRERMRLQHGDTLASIRDTGKMSDEAAATLKQQAEDLADIYTERLS